MERTRDDEGQATLVTLDPGAEIRRLKERHSEIERRLLELDRHLSLTPDEQLERARLKKEKLMGKDRIALLALQLPAA